MPRFQPERFREEKFLLYRRMADRDRAVLAVGLLREVDAPVFDARGHADEWYFGVLRYEWRHALFGTDGEDADHTRWYIPRYVIEWDGARTLVHARPEDADRIAPWIAGINHGADADRPYSVDLQWAEHVPRDRYTQAVRKLLAHIQRGDIYEVNYCTTRKARVPDFDPFAAFGTLDQRSQAPFSAFLREGDSYALCASPERFLAFNGKHVIGEPMKGTRPRHQDASADRALAVELANDAKERSENIMALDVMRHDLSRIAASGSVRVTELCAVRSYPRVHQLVSTVEAITRTGLDPLDVLRATFPMASMTGAPKVRAMQLIEEAEQGPRGLFSGSLGFFAPDGTGDFNVVIRTLLFDAKTTELSLTTGSAITALCDPEQEFEECEVKARSVVDALA
ncbi:MAG: anthranilate synthase component I family protein [Flavobacteriales bacterium]